MTNTAALTFPKNIYVRDENNKLFSFSGENGHRRLYRTIILRGDTVRIEAGYRYYDKIGNEINNINVLFQGYITKVDAKTPVKTGV